MKYFVFALLLILTMGFTPQNKAGHFKWLVGNWHLKDKDVHEHWRLANDTLLSAVSFHHTPQGAETVDENIQLVYRNGNYYYIPTVPDQNGGAAIEFKIVSETSNSFVAENLQHDFPQRIVYQLIDAQHLLAYIEGLDKGKQRRFDFFFIKGQ
ncbi:MAG: hypothetical protein KA149_05110 [Chitinophagales bacterium]|nr:hypothetical protein [Chitinophagales bacterium]